MGFWYMLGLLIGIGLLLYGIMQSSKKHRSAKFQS